MNCWHLGCGKPAAYECVGCEALLCNEHGENHVGCGGKRKPLYASNKSAEERVAEMNAAIKSGSFWEGK